LSENKKARKPSNIYRQKDGLRKSAGGAILSKVPLFTRLEKKTETFFFGHLRKKSEYC
jgi:hypothetical protein